MIIFLYNQSCFKNSDNRVKYFYVNCFKKMKSCENFELMKQIAKDMVTLCLAKLSGNDQNGIVSRSEEARLRLKCLFHYNEMGNNASESAKELNDKELKSQLETDGQEDEDKHNESFSTNVTFLDQEQTRQDTQEREKKQVDMRVDWLSDHIYRETIINNLTSENLSNTENLYYLPSLIDTLLRLMKQLPLWTNIMKNLYDSKIYNPTSSNIESYFKNIKTLLCDLKTKSHRLRIDEFIMKHFEYISGEIKLALSDLHLGKDNKTKSIIKRALTNTTRLNQPKYRFYF